MSGLRLGIVGTGDLGGALVRGMLCGGAVTAAEVRAATRSGGPVAGCPGVTAGTDPAAVAADSDVLILAVPPAQAGTLEVRAPGALVVSVMAGVTLARLRALTGSGRAVRAMLSPAAELGLAHVSLAAAEAVSADDRAVLRRLFGACGSVDEVPEEQIDLFTALTGPVPGFVAACAAAMAGWARARGIDPAVADRAVRQLFLASGTVMAATEPTPEARVREMIDYAGTTAAGLERLGAGDFARELAAALDAAVARARDIAG